MQQIEFVNNRSEYLFIPTTALSKITNMSRGHLYRCIKKLKEVELIIVTEEGIAVTDYYRELKNQDYIENWGKTTRYSKNLLKCGVSKKSR